MLYSAMEKSLTNQRVRAILLTEQKQVLFIKRIKPHNPSPYWVAPGGGVEDDDESLLDALQRELCEELGATYEVIEVGFVLKHCKANKQLEEHFYICRLRDYDISRRNGPEFDDPTRGQYIPDAIELTAEAIQSIKIQTEELRQWLLGNLDYLRTLA
ncbi:MAG: NUDIX hydrolase [Anaerolineae bacterium]|nr:NUDIX hydrolase [Anaerolineae bacterium]